MGKRFDTKRQSLGDFISDEVKAFEVGALALTRQAINETVDVAQTHTGKGGRMHVDTGFLRNSGVAALNSTPSGPERGEIKAKKHYDNGNDKHSQTNQSLITALANMKMGDTLVFGWTAEYAMAREATDMFVENAAAGWQARVERIAKKFLASKA
jgi:hypothetical protein